LLKLKYYGTLFLLLCLFTPLQADMVRAAVAANFSHAMKSIANEFEKDSGYQIQLVFGSSGKLYAQIMNGAPYQVFLSADTTKPQKLEQEGRALAGSRFTYARGSLVLWSANPDTISNDYSRLTLGDFRYIAVANPRLAPYGVAAREVMEYINLWHKLKHKLVTGENISQTYQFVSTGNAELGFVALSQVIHEGKIKTGSGWIVPQDYHAPILQDAVLLMSGKDNPAALALMEYLRSDKAVALINSFGYRL
jgi:molybdate transport system substrate-binding protein